MPYYSAEKKTLPLPTFVSILMFFQAGPPTFSRLEPAVAVFALLLLLIVISTFMLYFFYQRGFRIPSLLLSTRGLLFLFIPTIFETVAFAHLGAALDFLGEHEDALVEFYVNLGLQLVVIVGTGAFALWVAPIITMSPILSISHVPSRLIPDLSFYSDHFAMMLVGLLAAVCPEQYSAILFAVLAAIASIPKIRAAWRVPYLSRTHTNVFITLSVLELLIPAYTIVVDHFGVREAVIFWSSFGIAAVVLVVVSSALQRREQQYTSFLKSSLIKLEDSFGIVRFIQYAIRWQEVSHSLVTIV
jgi:hypothetical protein